MRNTVSNVCKWASYQIRKIAGCACAGNVGIIFPHPRFQRKPLVSDPDMHHGTCVTHVPWCMSGSLTCGDGENVPGIPGACAPAILRIWQEVHGSQAEANPSIFNEYISSNEYHFTFISWKMSSCGSSLSVGSIRMLFLSRLSVICLKLPFNGTMIFSPIQFWCSGTCYSKCLHTKYRCQTYL